MPRIPYFDLDKATPEYRDLLKGRFDLNIYRMLPHAETIAPGFLKMGRAILRESKLDRSGEAAACDRYADYRVEQSEAKIDRGWNQRAGDR